MPDIRGGYPGSDLTFSIERRSESAGARLSPIMQFGKISGLMPVDASPNPYGIQTDIIGTAGSSGSPIFNMEDGEVIGLAQNVLPAHVESHETGKKLGKANIGLVYGITNHIIFDLPKKTRDFFEHGIKINIDFATTGVTLP